jgi:hypothetical protein
MPLTATSSANTVGPVSPPPPFDPSICFSAANGSLSQPLHPHPLFRPTDILSPTTNAALHRDDTPSDTSTPPDNVGHAGASAYHGFSPAI